jgi:hypothetical protein
MIALKNEADVSLVQLISVFDFELMDRMIQKIIFAVPGAVIHPKDVKDGGFSGAGGAHDRDELSFFYIDVDAPQDEGL